MKVRYLPAALKGLQGMPKPDSKRLRAAMQEVAERHPERMSYVTEIVGAAHTWRIRKGDYRLIYTVIDGKLTVTAAGNRKDIHR